MNQVTSLAEDLGTPRPSDTKTLCGLSKIRMQMTDEEAQALDKAVEMIRNDSGSGRSKVYSAEWLTDVLRKHNYEISASTVSRHVAKRCRCV